MGSRTHLTTGFSWKQAQLALCCALPLMLAGGRMLAGAHSDEEGPFKPEVAARYLGADSCGECHQAAVDAWMESEHSTSFAELHRTDEAKAIADKLGIRRIKAEPMCATCHYTTQVQSGRVRAKYGVSCESCHGAAKDWVKIHDDYGGMDITRESETPAHRKMRFEKSAAAGMNHSEDLYRLTSHCYHCHVVGDQKIVEVGGHPTGSDIELVAWTQGEVRHNYLATDGKMNEPASPERLRLFYVTGRALDLEYSLRAAARASGKGAYFDAMAARVEHAKTALAQIQGKAAIAEVAAMNAAVNGIQVSPGNAKALQGAADKVGKAARDFLARSDGSELAAIDSLLPTKDQYKGKARE